MPLDPADSLQRLQQRLEQMTDRIDHFLGRAAWREASHSGVGTVTPRRGRRRSGTGSRPDRPCTPRLWRVLDLAPPVLHPRRMARLFRIFAVAAVLWIASAAGSAAAPLRTFYVDPAGNDSAAGSITSPWRTLQKAANTVHAGDTGDRARRPLRGPLPDDERDRDGSHHLPGRPGRRSSTRRIRRHPTASTSRARAGS